MCAPPPRPREAAPPPHAGPASAHPAAVPAARRLPGLAQVVAQVLRKRVSNRRRQAVLGHKRARQVGGVVALADLDEVTLAVPDVDGGDQDERRLLGGGGAGRGAWGGAGRGAWRPGRRGGGCSVGGWRAQLGAAGPAVWARARPGHARSRVRAPAHLRRRAASLPLPCAGRAFVLQRLRERTRVRTREALFEPPAATTLCIHQYTHDTTISAARALIPGPPSCSCWHRVWRRATRCRPSCTQYAY